MKSLIRTASLGFGLALTAGCASSHSQPNTFTFTADMPPDFAYVAVRLLRACQGRNLHR